jgi:N-acetylglutamate synthase-like GNAT family acetyltransferase
METLEINFEGYRITTDAKELDISAIHDFLSKYSTWSQNIPYEKVKRSIAHSLNFGLFYQGKQIGFARVISDFSTIAYLGDMYVLENYRGKGLSMKLVEAVLKHPGLQGLRRWILLTTTAPWLYKKYGFEKLTKPEIYMERYDQEVYKNVSD